MLKMDRRTSRHHLWLVLLSAALIIGAQELATDRSSAIFWIVLGLAFACLASGVIVAVAPAFGRHRVAEVSEQPSWDRWRRHARRASCLATMTLTLFILVYLVLRHYHPWVGISSLVGAGASLTALVVTRLMLTFSGKLGRGDRDR